MTHAEFAAAYRSGTIRVDIDRAQAARYLSNRLLLPLVAMPVLGIGVALALTGWIWSGLAVIALAIVATRLIKRSAPHFVLTQALQDERFYRDAMQAGLLRITAVDTPGG